MFRLLLALPLVATACVGDETVSGYADSGATFQLSEINGTAFPAKATVSFPQDGIITGEGPCNSFSVEQTAPYPWLSLGAFRVTRRACVQMPLERQFFQALETMTEVETSGTIIILRNEAGGEMVFNRI